MTTNHREPTQFELFPSTDRSFQDRESSRASFKDFSLSLDNVVIFSIFLIMTLVLAFSLGVEKGKKVALKESDPLKINTLQKSEDALQSETPVMEAVAQESPQVTETVATQTEAAQEEENKQPKVRERIIERTYTVQVASFKRRKNAEIEASRLKEIGYDSYVIPKGSHSIVCVGRFDQRLQAKELSGRLKPKYRDLLVRRL